MPGLGREMLRSEWLIADRRNNTTSCDGALRAAGRFKRPPIIFRRSFWIAPTETIHHILRPRRSQLADEGNICRGEQKI